MVPSTTTTKSCTHHREGISALVVMSVCVCRIDERYVRLGLPPPCFVHGLLYILPSMVDEMTTLSYVLIFFIGSTWYGLGDCTSCSVDDSTSSLTSSSSFFFFIFSSFELFYFPFVWSTLWWIIFLLWLSICFDCLLFSTYLKQANIQLRVHKTNENNRKLIVNSWIPFIPLPRRYRTMGGWTIPKNLFWYHNRRFPFSLFSNQTSTLSVFLPLVIPNSILLA